MSSQFADYEIVGSYNNQRFTNIDAERSINLFEYIDLKGKKPRSLISTSGLKNTDLVFGSTTGGFRNEYVLNNYEYFVIGSDIWRRDTNNVLTQLNTLPLDTSTGYVAIEANNNPNGPQLLFVDGKKGYIWDTATNQFTYDVKTVDPAFPDVPIDACFLDGYIIVANGGTNQFQLSGLNDAYSWGEVDEPFTVTNSTNQDVLIVNTTYALGMQFQVAITSGTTSTLPSPLATNTSYYAIPVVDPIHHNQIGIKAALSYSDALSNTAIHLTDDGTGTFTITNFTASSSGPSSIPGQLQIAQINSHPGNIVACATLHRRVFLFSTNFTEIWENQGAGSNLPLRRINALLMEYGAVSNSSIVTGFDKMFFLSQDRDGLGAVMEVIGTTAIPISNRALDFQLAQYASLNQVIDAKGVIVKENGIIFYRLNFTKANKTFVYNATLSNPQEEEGKLWHEEEVLNGDRHPAQTHGYFNGNNYYGHYSLPILYNVDSSYTTNDGEIIPRIRIGRAYVPATYNRTRTDRFMLDVIQGLTYTLPASDQDLLTENSMPIDTENGLDLLLEEESTSPISPDNQTIYLSISKDGGATYGYRQDGFIGGTGRRTYRTVWRKLGVIPRGQAFVPKVEFYGNISLIILGAAWAFEVMPE